MATKLERNQKLLILILNLLTQSCIMIVLNEISKENDPELVQGQHCRDITQVTVEGSLSCFLEVFQVLLIHMCFPEVTASLTVE